MDTDVLIVGVGQTTGLMLANQLVRRGVGARRSSTGIPAPRSNRARWAVQARALEIYSKMGIIEQALARGIEGKERRQHVGQRASGPHASRSAT